MTHPAFITDILWLIDSHGACELMSHFYDVSGEALNWNGLCMCGIYDLYDPKWPLLEVLRSFTLNLEWPRRPSVPNRPTVRTDGNSSNKMSDSLSDIKYRPPYTVHLQVPQIGSRNILKNINKKMEMHDRIWNW